MLKNLKSLNVLDLSFNNLETIKNVGELPENLSLLFMSNNKLKQLPKEIINFVPKLKLINLENNQFNNFPAALATIVSKGSTILFKGMCTIPKYQTIFILIHVFNFRQSD